MARYQALKDHIKENYKVLPKNQKKIADYFIDSFDKIPFLNVQEVSKATNTSVASIVRFAQRIGFKGFSELHDAIADSLQSQMNNKEIFQLFDKNKAEEDLLTSVANIDIKNINDTLNLIHRDEFDKTVQLILKSRKVFTVGLGISHLLSEILAYQLSQVAIDAAAFKNNYCPFFEQIPLISKKDLIITFSFPPYSRDTIDTAKLAFKKGISVIAITNKEASPITFFSKVNLIVHSENMLFTNSFAAISVLINTVATACALKNKSKTKLLQKETSEILEKYQKIIR
jgi:DNA-binding MurR/RpiR family transcriptional regulator